MQIIVVAIVIAIVIIIIIGVRYLRHKFVINEVAWLSGRGSRSSDGI